MDEIGELESNSGTNALFVYVIANHIPVPALNIMIINSSSATSTPVETEK